MSDTQTCKDCRYWQQKEVFVYEAYGDSDYIGRYEPGLYEGYIYRGKQKTNYGVCTHPRFVESEDFKPINNETGEITLVAGDELLHQCDPWEIEEMLVGENFGCIHHLPKRISWSINDPVKPE